MMKPDYKNMTQQQLKEHLLENRNDEEGWAVFFERLSHFDPNQGYSPNLQSEEMEKIFKAKLNRK